MSKHLAPSAFRKAISGITAALLILFLLAALRLVFLKLNRYLSIPWALAGIAVVLLTLAAGALYARRGGRLWGSALIALGLGLRMGWLAVVRTVPVSDFETFYRFAKVAASGAGLELAFGELVTHGPGYPGLLAVVFHLFGASILVGQLVNLALWFGLVLIVPWCARRMFGETAARWSLVLLVFWPVQVMYGSVLATEHLQLPLVWLAIGLVVGIPQRSMARGLATAAFAGLLFGLASLARPSTIIAIVGSVLFLFAHTDGLRSRIGLIVTLGACTLAMTQGYAAVSHALGDRRTVSVSACSLLMGTNFSEGGHWNGADSARIGEAYATMPPDQATRSIVRFALMRLVESPAKIPGLLLAKLNNMWADERFGSGWATERVEAGSISEAVARHRAQLGWVSQLFYALMLAAGIIGLIRGRYSDGAFLISLVILSAVALHALVEAQARYHYPWDVGVLLLAAAGMSPKSPSPAIEPR